MHFIYILDTHSKFNSNPYYTITFLAFSPSLAFWKRVFFHGGKHISLGFAHEAQNIILEQSFLTGLLDFQDRKKTA